MKSRSGKCRRISPAKRRPSARISIRRSQTEEIYSAALQLHSCRAFKRFREAKRPSWCTDFLHHHAIVSRLRYALMTNERQIVANPCSHRASESATTRRATKKIKISIRSEPKIGKLPGHPDPGGCKVFVTMSRYSPAARVPPAPPAGREISKKVFFPHEPKLSR